MLTRAIGIEPEIDPYVSHTNPTSGDRLLLCSDGLFNELPNDEIVGILSTVTQPDESAEQLVAAAKDHGGHDNITRDSALPQCPGRVRSRNGDAG